MILITAATGQVGREATRGLVEAGVPVRALVRDRSRASGLEGAELVQGSFEDETSLARAMVGVDTLFLAGRDNPDAVAQQARVLGQARRAGVRHIVKLSAIGASLQSRIALMREHAEVDEEVQRGEATWTLLQPHLYLQNLLRAGDEVRHQGLLTAPMGAASIPLVDTRDVGAAAAMVLANPDRHAGRSYALTGPEALRHDEIAGALATLGGKPVRYVPVAPEAYEASLLAAGVPGWRAYDLAHIAAAYRPADLVVSPVLTQLLGRAPRSLATFLRDHRATFAAAGPGAPA